MPCSPGAGTQPSTGTSLHRESRCRTASREFQRPDARRAAQRDSVLRSRRRPRQDRQLGCRLQSSAASLVAEIHDPRGLCRPPHRNGRSATQPRPAPPIVRCYNRATWRTKPRGSNRGRMKVRWQVSGTKGRLKAQFAAVRVRTADGPPQRIWDKGQQHLPGDEAWLIGEQRASGEKKYYLANLPAAADLRTLAATIKARWICEQAHQQLKEELGLDHFEGRSWQGLHRHALMTMIAYAFLQHIVASHTRGGKKRIYGPPPQPTMPAVRHAIVDLILRPPSQHCPYCRRQIREKQRRKHNLPK
ncbi:protein of unknown function [Bradyrhizobium vignae]|uniref:Transposase IS4-like domain-containing protein n=1 Tax=Bradyrhizobium vignae TaxID=1549949 RepID=A0A2U3Q6T7_9BRAD|nr:protein of unknown function [Bradyrhizobium vignae]